MNEPEKVTTSISAKPPKDGKRACFEIAEDAKPDAKDALPLHVLWAKLPLEKRIEYIRDSKIKSLRVAYDAWAELEQAFQFSEVYSDLS